MIIFAPYYPGHRDAAAVVHRFPSVTFPAKMRFPLPLPVAPGMCRRIAALGIDLFHTHHPFAMGAAALRIARRLRRPLVTTIHTQYEQYLHYIPLPGALLRPTVRWSVARYCNTCQAVTTPAAGMAEVIRDYGVRAEVTVVPNGIDLRRYRGAAGDGVRRSLSLDERHAIGLFTGRIAPEKNLPALLKAARLVADRHQEFRLVVLGDGPDLPALRRQAEAMGLAEVALFPGAVPHEEVAPFCAAADLCHRIDDRGESDQRDRSDGDRTPSWPTTRSVPERLSARHGWDPHGAHPRGARIGHLPARCQPRGPVTPIGSSNARRRTLLAGDDWQPDGGRLRTGD